MKNFKPYARQIALTFIIFLHCLLPIAHTIKAQWTKTAGPTGISVNTFFNSGSVLFAGTTSKGPFRSANQGASWTPSNRGLENATVYSFTSDGTYLYAGTNTGVFRSSNNGLTWTAANAGIENLAVLNMVIGGGFLFAGSSGLGIYRSADQGSTWQNANGNALNFSIIYAMCYVNDVLIVEADNYLFKSRNAGNTWFVDQGSTAFYVIKHFLVLGDTILASARNGVFRSFDGGINWSNFQPVLADEYTELLGFVRSNNIIYTADKRGMFRSTNLGVSWTPIASTGLRFGTRFNNYFIQSGNTFLIAMDELGVFRSTNTGQTWSQSIAGFPPLSVIDNAILNINDSIVSGTHSNGIYATINNGNAWRKIGTRNNADTLSNAIVFALLNPAPNIILAGTCGDGLYRSTNNGRTWRHITAGLPYTLFDNYECDFALTRSNNNILLATANGLYYSNNNGLTWNASNLTGENITAFSVAANRNVAVAGIAQGVFPFQSGIYRSTNSGVTWTFVAAFFDDMISMASDGVDHFYAGGFFGNLRSTNNGISWSSMGAGIANGFTIKVVDTTNVFIGNGDGIYFSNNQGNTFVNVNEGLDPVPNNSVQGLEASSNFLYAGLAWNGVWRRPLSDFGINLEEQVAKTNTPANVDINKQYDLKISPNPARDKTIIQFETAAAGKAQLKVINQSGKTVLQSVEFLSPGIYNKTIDVKNFSPGIYLVQVLANGKTSVAKLMVSR